MRVIDRQLWLRVSGYLDHALDLPPEDREAYLVDLRAEDPTVVDDVAALLAEHRELSAEGFLDAAALPPPTASLTGVRIGAYTLVSPMGQGGMGSVWLAVRSDGRFEGRAALKLLNAALVGRAGEERFRREGTILARLTHPHIARLIDAGVTATGQPYLVLEHIEGRHIDRYCDEERLGIDERIRLFLDVQSAVAHAHANLIVHRDLKPSNVLVTVGGQVKLLDFGIAKLLEHDSATAASVLTVEGGHVLTPKYAAPEQVTGDRITTATDVYSLGVLLFELLSGQHPTGLEARSPAEFVKAVADAEPTRLSSIYDAGDPFAMTLAVHRATTPERLRRLLRGDLDTILSKSLKKHPAERYESVAEFADDLRRYLTDQPIRARPDTLTYRTTKFVRRHRHSLAASAVALAAIVAVVALSTVQLTRERDRARLEADKASTVSELLTGLLTGADPYRTPDAKEPTVQNLLDIGAERIARDYGDRPELQAEMFTVIGRTYQRMGLRAKALPLLEQALAVGRRSLGTENARVAQSLNDLGVLQRDLGNLAAAEPLLVESLAIRRRVLGAVDKDVAVTLVELARVLRDRGRVDEAEAPAREALSIRRQVFGEEHRETATSKNELALLLLERGDLDGAEPFARENVATSERVLGPDHPNVSRAKANLGLLLLARGDAAAAEVLLRGALNVEARALGGNHLEYAVTVNNLGLAVEAQERLDEAQSLFEQAVRIARERQPADHPRVVTYALNLARVRIERGDGAGTEAALRHVLEVRERLYPAGHWRIGQAQALLGAALLAQGRDRDAEPLLVAADRALAPVPGQQARDRTANRARLDSLRMAKR